MRKPEWRKAMYGSYWETARNQRLSRRRAMAAASLAAAGAAALSVIGCGGGGDDKNGQSRGQGSGLLYTRVDSTDRAKPGGTYNSYMTVDVVSLDPLTASSFQTLGQIAAWTYPKLMQFSLARHPKVNSGEVEGQAATGYEISGDKLQVTFHLRPGMKWDARSPTNGREIDAQDVVFSWNKFARVSPLRRDIAYEETNQQAPVESVSAPDNRTVVFKLKRPDASVVPMFATVVLFFVMPREADGGFDPKADVRGYGPYLLEEYKPSTQVTWRRAPDYHIKGRPFIDKLSFPIVPEYATRVAQFKAGNIWTTVHRNEDMIPAKKENPALNLLQGADFPKTPWSLTFGYEGNSPFKDERMRQAVSMLIDHEAVIDVIAGRPSFAAEGIDTPIRQATVVGAGWEGYWIDPRDDKKFGPNAKYLSQNVAEAKKLISAAGFANGVDTSWFYAAGQIYGAAYSQVAEMLPGMLAEGGIRAKAEPKEYANDWLPNFYYGYANANKGFNGIMWRGEQTYPTMGTQLFATFHSAGPRYVGLTDTGNSAQAGDPKVNADIEKIRAEFDAEKQKTLVQDLIRYMTGRAYNLPTGYPVSTPPLSLQWPCIGNLGIYNGSTGSSSAGELALDLWVDATKPPLAPA